MNCWKTINFSKQYGSHRLFILSSLTMFFTFILLYVPSTYFFVSYKHDNHYFIFFVLGLLLLYPIHKLLHYLPLAHLGNKVVKKMGINKYYLPTIMVRINEPISKNLFLLTLTIPFFVITLFFVVACYLFPHYVHYFTILIAFHVGICAPDFIRVKNILFAPKDSFIEESKDGIEILVLRSNYTSY
ncbi:DUF3267 domain-containing protein [Cytobacillus sp. Hz8]|uniref:DUF3267 domain-containing protein n=1 Tax=Cytobacillus sp. Hz8 TaxID=3347168 RepID=UPI0035E042B1